MSTPMHARNQRALLGLGALVLTLVVTIATIGVGRGWYDAGYGLEVSAPRTGLGLEAGSDVRIRGVPIGRVTGVALDADERAIISVHVEDGVSIPADATAAIDPVSLIGPKYVHIDPGPNEDSGPFLAAGERLSAEAEPTELADVLAGLSDLLTAVDPADIDTVVSELAAGYVGTEDELHDTFDNSQTLLEVFDERSGDAERMMTGLADLSDEMVDAGPTIVATGRDLAAALPEILAREGAFEELLLEADRASVEVTTLLDEHQGSIDELVAGMSAATIALDGAAPELENLVEVTEVVFDTLGRIAHVDNPDGSLGGAVELILRLQVCHLVDAVPCGATATTVQEGP